MKTDLVEIIDNARAILPPRSRLYHLDPVRPVNGLGESLTSYIARLAAAHCLPLWVLVTRELAPLFRRKTIVQVSEGECDLLGALGAAVNGNNNTANESVSVMGELTAQTGLRDLTMLVAGDRLASTPLMRRTQAWCPCCLDEWSRAQQELYYPLVWSLAAVRACPVHRIPLMDCCSRCGRSHQPLARRLRIGHCPWCDSWLGTSAHEAPMTNIQSPQVTDWEVYSSSTAAKLLADLANAGQPSGNRESLFATNVSSIVERTFGGSMNALANSINIHHGTISDWISQFRKPSLNSVLVLAFRFTLPAARLLLEPLDSNEPVQLRPAVAGDAARLRPPLRKTSRETIEQTLRAAIQKGSLPPPSLRSVCTQAGFHQTQASRRFPELSRQISDAHRLHRSERRRQGEEFLRNAIRTAVNELHRTGVYPSYRKVRARLAQNVFLRGPVAAAEREAAMKDLGLALRAREG